MDLSFLQTREYRRRLIIVAAALFADLVFVLGWQLLALRRVIPQVNELSRDVRRARQDIATRNNLEREYERLAAEIAAKQARIVPQAEIPLFLSEVSQIAQGAGARLMKMTPDPLNRTTVSDNMGDAYFNLPITLSLRCGYHNLGVFMSRLAGSRRHIRLTSLEITSLNDPPFEFPVKMIIEIVVRK